MNNLLYCGSYLYGCFCVLTLWVSVTQVGCEIVGISPRVLGCSSWLYLVAEKRPRSFSLCVTDGPVPIGKCDHIYPEVYVCVSVCVSAQKKGVEKKCTLLLDSDEESVHFTIWELKERVKAPPFFILWTRLCPFWCRCACPIVAQNF